MSQLIYQPKGRAFEYAALACNVYAGCSHGCVYCWAPTVLQRDRCEFVNAHPRKDFVSLLYAEARKKKAQGLTGQVLLSFACDPYQPLDADEQQTREAIKILHAFGFSVCVLTKGGTRALRDLSLFTPRDAFATTLTLLDPHESRKWEPGAAEPEDRLAAIRAFHQRDVPTWVSLEPVLDPDVSLQIVRETHEFVDVFKVGTLNYHPHAKTIDWRHFARDAVTTLESLGYRRNFDPHALARGDFYIKRDLAQYLREN